MSKTVLSQVNQFSISTHFSSIWSTDIALTGATTPSQSGPGSDGNEGVLRILQSSSITGTLTSDCFVSYPGHLLGGSYLSAAMQSVYSAVLADWWEVYPFAEVQSVYSTAPAAWARQRKWDDKISEMYKKNFCCSDIHITRVSICGYVRVCAWVGVHILEHVFFCSCLRIFVWMCVCCRNYYCLLRNRASYDFYSSNKIKKNPVIFTPLCLLKASKRTHYFPIKHLRSRECFPKRWEKQSP